MNAWVYLGGWVDRWMKVCEMDGRTKCWLREGRIGGQTNGQMGGLIINGWDGQAEWRVDGGVGGYEGVRWIDGCKVNGLLKVVDGQMNNERMDKRTNGWMDDGWTDRQNEGWMDGQVIKMVLNEWID